MIRSNLARGVRFLRRHKRWRQVDLGGRAGVSREMISRLERDRCGGMTLDSIARVIDALGASLDLTVRWHGEQMDRLMDSAHAGMQQAVAELLHAAGWVTAVEVSFNHYGDRGRVDVLAYLPGLRCLLVIEVKTALGNLQETLGRLDIKARVARGMARELGWGEVSVVIPCLVIGDSRRARSIVAEHAAMFTRFGVRGRAAVAWVRHPTSPHPPGLLWFAKRPNSHQVTAVRRNPPTNRSSAQAT